MLTRELLNQLSEKIFQKMIVRRYKILFEQMMKFDNLLSKNDRKIFQIFETQIIKTVFKNDICLVACTLINVDIIIMKNFKIDYIIIQETTRANNKNVYIIMTQSSDLNQIMHLSKDDEQFIFNEVQRKNNCFIFFINTSLFERFVNLKYSLTQLMKQRRIISFINDWISQIWYNEQMKSVVDFSKRFNIDKIINVLKSQYELNKSAIFLNIVETSQQVDVNKSKQNETKFMLSTHLARLLIKIKIFAKKIIIFIDYIAQKNLINRFIINNFDELENVKIHIVNKFQEEKFLMMIFNIVGNDRLDFL